jgi:hypothetical protein
MIEEGNTNARSLETSSEAHKRLVSRVDSSMVAVGFWDKQIPSGKEKKGQIDLKQRIETAKSIASKIEHISEIWGRVQNIKSGIFQKHQKQDAVRDLFKNLQIGEPNETTDNTYIRYFPSGPENKYLRVFISTIKEKEGGGSLMKSSYLGTVNEKGDIVALSDSKAETVRLTTKYGLLCQKIESVEKAG